MEERGGEVGERAADAEPGCSLVVGCQRSGTTLATLLVGSHRRARAYLEPGGYELWADPARLARERRDQGERGARLLVFQAGCLTQQLDAADGLVHELRHPAFPFAFRYRGEALLFLARDPRDVATSLMAMRRSAPGDDWIDAWPGYVDRLYPRTIPGFGERYAGELERVARAGEHAFAARAALYWKVKTDAAFRYRERGFRLLALLYEDLVSRPRDVLERVFAFLGLELDERALRHHELDHPGVREAELLARGGRSAADPIDGGSIGRHRGRLAPEAARLVLEIAGETWEQVARGWRIPVAPACP